MPVVLKPNVPGTVDSWMVGRRISETRGIDRGAGDMDVEGTRLLFGFNHDVLNKKTDGATHPAGFSIQRRSVCTTCC